ncbi:hypothetical protein ACFLR1_00410 [Bacteroidota bacterium]
MNKLNQRLTDITARLNELESNPSNLVKDQVLADLRALYDAVKAIDVVVAPATVAAPVVEVPVKAEVLIEPEVEEPEPVLNPEATVNELHEELTGVATQPKAEVVKETPKEAKQEVVDPNKGILAGRLNKMPVEDLSTAIPLNEKFGIIRNLFNGNASDFADAILKLNNAKTADEMAHYLELLGKRLGWNEETESYKTFWGYVDRKMMTTAKLNANSNQ